MTYVSGIQYTKPLEHGMNEPYDGINIKSDRKSGWMVRHPLMGWKGDKPGQWITAIPDRALAGKIEEALCNVAIAAAKDGKAEVPE